MPTVNPIHKRRFDEAFTLAIRPGPDKIRVAVRGDVVKVYMGEVQAYAALEVDGMPKGFVNPMTRINDWAAFPALQRGS